MSISLKLLLDLTSPEVISEKLLKKYIKDALMGSDELRVHITNIRIGPKKPTTSLHEIRQAAGRARQATLSPKKRKALAKRAAKARWGK